MSILLPTVSLSGATVGTTGSVSFSPVQVSANPRLIATPPTVHIYNESGCGLQLFFQIAGNSTFVPAGGWLPVQLSPGESGFTYKVSYVLPNAPISQLLAVYYDPSETPPSIGTLGNSPLNVGNPVNPYAGVNLATFISNVSGSVGGTDTTVSISPSGSKQLYLLNVSFSSTTITSGSSGFILTLSGLQGGVNLQAIAFATTATGAQWQWNFSPYGFPAASAGGSISVLVSAPAQTSGSTYDICLFGYYL